MEAGVAPAMASGRRSQPVDVFIVDADPSQRRALAGMIAERALGRFLPHACASEAEARAAQTSGGSSAIVIADLETIGGAARLSNFAAGEYPLIATSASGSLTTVVAAMKAGATDFLPKPIGAKALIERLEAALVGWRRERPAPRPQPAAPAFHKEGRDFSGFIGRSPPMRAVYEHIRRMAPSRAPVFITGESGTGKEVCAEAIHQHSGPAERPFVAI